MHTISEFVKAVIEVRKTIESKMIVELTSWDTYLAAPVIYRRNYDGYLFKECSPDGYPEVFNANRIFHEVFAKLRVPTHSISCIINTGESMICCVRPYFGNQDSRNVLIGFSHEYCTLYRAKSSLEDDTVLFDHIPHDDVVAAFLLLVH